MSKQLKNIIIFSEVYSEGNYRDASANLGMSIATISRAIRELEEDSGIQLFINVKGEFRPTVYANSLYEQLNITNTEIVNSYNLFKSNSRYVNVLIPPQMSSYNLVDKLVEFNEEFDTELIINEGLTYNSYEDAYSSLINGELDFMLDDKPNNAMNFVSEKIGEYKASLIASKKYYDSIGSEVIDEKTKFAKYSWLGQTGGYFHQYFGIAPEKQVGFVTKNVSNYFQVIKETRFVGICSVDALPNISENFVYEQEPFMTVELYFVTTKAALHNKPVVKWFYENFKRNKKITPGRDVSVREMNSKL
ncbi:LysR family transcriptional regulator [Vibrio coralliilyticus]|uniref:LysR family transcriptional regulator n=1 Tax=Vibrio coralliilyticus TaxID=190893 RepID=UPI0015603504|nr:LysR family transcriptional regulator [Vibrio coralliilyticus]NRF28148.1 LysR family transcriptional regulator [Vibrio coralliilyticus]NRF82268.1 LysR family transcriptional regulator [Vibrio coralliilyticus]